MLDKEKELFRWGPIPGRLITVDDWSPIAQLYPGRLHRYYWPESYTIFRQGEMLFLSDLKDLESVGARVFRQVIMSQSLRRYQRVWQKSVKDLFSYCRRVTASRLTLLTDKQLPYEWRHFHRLLRPFWEAAIIPELAAYGGASILRQALIAHGLHSEDLQIAVAILSAPEKLSFYQEEERDFLKLCRIRSKSALTKALQRHFQRYFWIENSYGATHFLTLKDFQSRLKDSKSNWRQREREIENHLPRIRKEKAVIIKKYHLPFRIQKIARSVSLSIGWQDERKKQIFRYLHYFELFLREFSRRSGVPLNHLSTAMVSEIVPQPSARQKQQWQWRSRHPYVLDLCLRRHRVLTGERAQKIVRDFWPHRRNSSRREFTGIVAHPGPSRLTGQAFVVRNYDQLRRFPTGAILVSTQTAPEYVSAIRKARAIVTDFGGITSHAAIVSREYDKPCIVGTKYATSVLRTGDRVVINARRGRVKKL